MTVELSPLTNTLAALSQHIAEVRAAIEQAQDQTAAITTRHRQVETTLAECLVKPTGHARAAMQSLQAIENKVGRPRQAGLEPAARVETWLGAVELLDQVADAIIAWGMDDRVLFWNRGAEAMYGWTRDVALGRLIYELLPAEFPGKYAALKAGLAGHEHWEGELFSTRRDGTHVTAAGRWSLRRDERGQAAAILAIHTDVTGRRRTQRLVDRAVERVGRLQAVTNALLEAITPAEVVQVMSEHWFQALDPAAGVVLALTPEEEWLRVLGSAGYPAAVVERFDRTPATAARPWAEAARTGRPIFLPSARLARQRYPRLEGDVLAGHAAWAILPLVVKGRAIGVICLAFQEEGDFSQEERSFMLTLAGQCAQALERTRLYAEAQAEIRARQQAEVQLKGLVQEKEMLLQEVHHRVKNNLQSVSNLLYLQSAYISDEQARKMFRNTQDRVHSIALVHEKLYQAKNVTRLNSAEYIQSLAAHLIQAYKTSSATISLRVDFENVPINFELAATFGVIVNELITNALKHAFPAGLGRPGEIRVTLKEGPDGQIYLTVSDNGVGLPEDFDLARSKSLGLQLVHWLAQHLDGQVELSRAGGTTFNISFRQVKPKPVEV